MLSHGCTHICIIIKDMYTAHVVRTVGSVGSKQRRRVECDIFITHLHTQACTILSVQSVSHTKECGSIMSSVAWWACRYVSTCQTTREKETQNRETSSNYGSTSRMMQFKLCHEREPSALYKIFRSHCNWDSYGTMNPGLFDFHPFCRLQVVIGIYSAPLQMIILWYWAS